MAGMEFSFTDNSGEVLEAFEQHVLKALETVGLVAEGNAKVNITRQKAVDTGNLRNSITHKVIPDEQSVYIGTNVEYGIYNEFGTGEYAENGGRRTKWAYQDDEGNWHMTTGMKPRPYLRPAVADHATEYQDIIDSEMRS